MGNLWYDFRDLVLFKIIILCGSRKLLEYLEDGHIELYNLFDDPGESQNSAKDEPGRDEYLLDKLHNWKSETGARGIKPNPGYKDN